MDLVFKIYAFIFGILFGSFINLLIYRIPRNKNIITPSSCESCGNKIKWFHNIPLLSFIFLKRKCAFCKKPLSYRHFFIELLTGISSLLLFPERLDIVSMAFFLFYFSVFCALTVHFFIDIDFKILPDSVNLYLGMIFLCYSVMFYSWKHYVLGAVIAFTFTYGVSFIFYKLKGAIGLGGGDIKLYTVLGIYLGPEQIIHNIFFSCFLGSLVGVLLIAVGKMSRTTPLAFGPFIIIVAALQIYFPNVLAHVIKIIMPV